MLKRHKVKSIRDLHSDIDLITELEKHSTVIGITGIKDTLKDGI